MSRALGVEIDGGSEHFYTASKATLLNWFPVDCPGDIIRSNLPCSIEPRMHSPMVFDRRVEFAWFAGLESI